MNLVIQWRWLDWVTSSQSSLSVIEKLDKKANVVDVIEVSMMFSKWLEFRAKSDPYDNNRADEANGCICKTVYHGTDGCQII